MKQSELVLYSTESAKTVLMDKRQYTYGIVFGTIEKVASQYGVKMEQNSGYLKFTAPKMRLQMFMEKLHFAAQHYSFSPPKCAK